MIARMTKIGRWFFALARGIGLISLVLATLLVVLVVVSVSLLTVYVSFRTAMLLAMIVGVL